MLTGLQSKLMPSFKVLSKKWILIHWKSTRLWMFMLKINLATTTKRSKDNWRLGTTQRLSMKDWPRKGIFRHSYRLWQKQVPLQRGTKRLAIMTKMGRIINFWLQVFYGFDTSFPLQTCKKLIFMSYSGTSPKVYILDIETVVKNFDISREWLSLLVSLLIQIKLF